MNLSCTTFRRQIWISSTTSLIQFPLLKLEIMPPLNSRCENQMSLILNKCCLGTDVLNEYSLF